MYSNKLFVQFVGNNTTTSSEIAQTNDNLFLLIIISAILIACFAALSVLLVNKIKKSNVVSAKHLHSYSGIAWINKVFTKSDILIIGAIVLSFIASFCALSFTSNAYAEEDGVIFDKDTLKATYNADMTINFENTNFKNTSDLALVIDTINVTLSDEVKSSPELQNAVITINTLEGIAYSGPANGQIYMPKHMELAPLLVDMSSLFNFRIDGIDASVLDTYNNKNVFEIEIVFDRTYTTIVDLEDSELGKYEQAPIYWFPWATSNSMKYASLFKANTKYEDIYAEWKDVQIWNPGFDVTGFDKKTGTLTEDTTFTFEYTQWKDLNDYSFSELKNIADDISIHYDPVLISTSKYYQKFDYFAKEGKTKKVALNSENNDALNIRIIGINHDTKAEDPSMHAGLTFMSVNAPNMPYKFNENPATTNVNNWSGSLLRQNMNCSGGSFYDIAPQDLLNVITPVNKCSVQGWINDPTSPSNGNNWSFIGNYVNTQDNFFVLSYTELTGLSTASGTPKHKYGIEGSRYEYIMNDPWQKTSWRQSYVGPLMSNINNAGYEWFLSPEGQAYYSENAFTAYFACKDAGGIVKTSNPEYSIERSVFYEAGGPIPNYSTAQNIAVFRFDGGCSSAIGSFLNSTINPCFCL